MTAIPGSVRFTGFVAPSDSGDTYAVTDDTYHRGGFRPVADTTARDAITEDRRKVGMLVYSIADDKYYRCTVATSPPTWVEAAMGGGVVTPEFVVTTPRALTDDDHTGNLIGAVPAGLVITLPDDLTAGTTVNIGCVGFVVEVRPAGTSIITGRGNLAACAGFQLSTQGHAVTLLFVGTPPLGVPTWIVSAGIGIAYITDGAGTPTGDHIAFGGLVPSSVAGNFLEVDPDYEIGDSGYNLDNLIARPWAFTYADETERLADSSPGAGDVGKKALQFDDMSEWRLTGVGPIAWTQVNPPGGGGVNLTTFDAATIDLIDDTDFTAVETTLYVTEGSGYIIEVTPTTGTGLLTIELYQDAARLEVVYSMYVDLTDATTYRSAEVFGFELETDGTLYGTAFVSGVAGSETFDISVKVIGFEPSAAPAPLPSPYGQGIEDDGGGLPRIALASNGGLGFDIGDNLVITPDVTAPATIALGVGGASVTGAVTTTTDEDIAAKKRFTAVGSEPLAAAGYPTAGTYLEGHEVIDSSLVKWRCTSAGTPGLWQLVDCVADLEADYSTALLAPGAVEMLQIPVIGEYGVLQRIQVWGVVATAADYASDFRARIFLTADGFGRDLVWQGVGITRQSYLLAQLDAATSDLSVNDEDQFDTDEAIIVYEDDTRYELARITERTANQISIDEILVDASSWAADTLVCSVTQFDAVPFRNGDPTNRQKIFLQFRNDSDVNSVIFYARVLPISFGAIMEELPS